MAGLKDYQISVYVANLGKYVEGVLQGAWITLPMPAERLQDTLKTEVGLGGRYEEYAIHDYEGGEGLLATVANPGEYESLTDLNLMCRAFEAREDDDPDVYEKVQTVRDDLDAAPRTPLQYANLALNSDEIPYHSYDAPSSAESKEAKYAWTAVNHGWASDAVWSMFDTGLGYLIDMEMYGRDLKLDGDVSLGDNGYLEDADWPSDIDGRYSREEIAEEVEWLDDFDAKTGSPAAFDLASLVQPGERIADYTISGTGTNWGAPSYLNRTPIVGLKKFRFDDRRCGSLICARIGGDITTTGSAARRWNSSRPVPARASSPVGLPYRRIPRETGSGCTGPAARRRSWEATAAEGTTGRRRSPRRATASRAE